MSYDYSTEIQQLAAQQLEELTTRYADETIGLGLWECEYDATLEGGSHDFDFDYPAQVTGMRPLDYDPDTDDYEYQMSRFY